MPSGGLAGTATNTLQGEDVLGMLEAAAQEQAQALAQRTQQTGEAAQQAQGQYQQAAQAPQEVPNDFVQNLFSNLASVVSQQPSYRENQQQVAAQHKADLLKKRADNLQALRDIYSQKADEAQKAGDLENAEKYRTKLEGLHDKYQLVNANADRAERARQNELDRANARTIAGIRAGQQTADQKAELSATFDNEVKDQNGVQYLPLTNIPVKLRPAALQYAKDNGMASVDPKADDRLGRLKIARQNAADMLESLREFAPTDWKQRLNPLDERGMVRIKAADIAQSNPAIRNYHTYFEGLIEQLVALAGGAGSGVRINKAEIERLLKIAPKADTPIPVAEGWVKQVNRLIDNTEQPILGRANLPSGKPAEAPAPVRMVWMLAPDKKTRQQVPSTKVDAFKARGATVVPVK